ADAAHPTRASATRKLRCERYLRRHLDTSTRLLVVRLGLVIGRFDTGDRLTYWLDRALRGGDVLIPMNPGQPIQLINAADVAIFVRNTLDRTVSGVINVVGPRTTARELLDYVLPPRAD